MKKVTEFEVIKGIFFMTAALGFIEDVTANNKNRGMNSHD